MEKALVNEVNCLVLTKQDRVVHRSPKNVKGFGVSSVGVIT